MRTILRTLTTSVTIAFAIGGLTLALRAPDWRVSVRAQDCEGEPDDSVQDYAERCYRRMGISHNQVPDTFVCKAAVSKQLYTRVDGEIQDLGLRVGGNLTTFPSTCDKPAWLQIDPNSNPNTCYGHTYIQKITIGAAVEGALLCRHKRTWKDGDKDFDDIAIILHNATNGETCWFQSPDGQATLDGTKVPAPDTEDGVNFWLSPSATAKINCIRCHDSGPWMNSRWMSDESNGLLQDRVNSPYVNNGIAFETDWKEPLFVWAGDATCNTCHKIAADDVTKTKRNGKLEPYQTCSEWIERTVGRKYSKRANVTGKKFGIAYWMPEDHAIEEDSDDLDFAPMQWDNRYKDEVDLLLSCCNARGDNEVGDCNVHTPKPRKPSAQLQASVSAFSGVRISASRNGAPLSPPEFESVAPDQGGVHVVASGTFLTVGWEADPTHTTCTIATAFPPGVRVGGTETPSVGTATNWGLDETPQSLGPLVIPGQYRFTIYCDPRIKASLTFEVAGTPATFLDVQAIVNNDAAPAARTGVGDPTETSIDAPLLGRVYIRWRAKNVQNNSCVQTETFAPPGPPTRAPSFDESGFTQILLHAATHQTYSLTCRGLDGTSRTVSTTVRLPAAGVFCDIDGDQDVDRNDLTLIAQGREEPVTGPDDPRDANSDGVINVGDARMCALRCTRAQCAP